MRVLSGVLGCALVLVFARAANSASEFAPMTDAEARAAMSAPDRHVRAADKAMADVITAGLKRSGTFAHLVLALNRSDVIVYIETGRVLPTSIVGRLLLAAGPEGSRYLRIQVSGHPGSNDMIALVGHELRHALEVAESPQVRDEAGLIALYERIGHPTSTGAMHQYDTHAAQDAGRRVKAELKG
jgi:hypothetical protein